MAALILPSRRVVQPQQAVQIDWSNPLARKLAAIHVGGVPIDLVSGQAITRANNPVEQIGQHGRGWRTSNGTSARVDVPAPGFDQSANEWSWAAAFQYFTPTAANGYLLGFPLAGSYRVASFFNGFSFWWTTNVTPDYSLVDPGFEIGKSYLTSGSSPVNGAADFNSAKLFINGVYRAPSSGNNASITAHTGAKVLSIGNRSSDSARGSDVVPALVVLWNRALTDAEHQAWAANPWQIFKPVQARIWVAAATASGGTGSITATESGTDTAALTGAAWTSGALSATESSPDTLAAAGAMTPLGGALAVTESGPDAAAIGATALAAGSLSATELGTDVLSFQAGLAAQVGVLDAAESSIDYFADDVFSATGTAPLVFNVEATAVGNLASTEPVRTNWIRNSALVNAVVPSTQPTYWTNLIGTASGITRSLVGLGSENGMPYLDMRVSGTFTGATGTAFYIQSEYNNSISAAFGQAWTASFYMSLQAGSLTGATLNLAVSERDATGGSLASSFSPSLTVGAGSLQRYSHSRTITRSDIAFVQPHIRCAMVSGSAYDFTLRIAAPQMELDSLAFTEPTAIIYTSGTVASAADSAVISGVLGGIAQAAGSLNAHESSADTAAATGAAIAASSLAAAESGADTFSATSGTPALSGALSASESGVDTAAAALKVSAAASLGALESGTDAAGMTGLSLVLGFFASAEPGADDAAMTGFAGAIQAQAQLDAFEAGQDAAAASVSALIAGALAAAESGGDIFSDVVPLRLVNARTTTARLIDYTTAARVIERTTAARLIDRTTVTQ